MFEDRDDRSPAWAWLRGFAYFLLAWPLLSLLALHQFELDDWPVFGLGLGVILLLLPTGLIDGEDMTTTERVAAGIVGIPLGLIVLLGVGVVVVKGLPKLLREWRTARLLARRPEALDGFALQPDSSVVLLRLADGQQIAFDMAEDGYLPRSLTVVLGARSAAYP